MQRKRNNDCNFTLPAPIFHYISFMGKCEICAQLPRSLITKEIIEDSSSLQVGSLSQSLS
jgi:hypothetical protein